MHLNHIYTYTEPVRRVVPLLSVLAVLWLLVPTAQAQPTDQRAHDPSLIEHDGTYYVFATGRGIHMLASDDLRNWKRMGRVFEEAPAWAEEVVDDFRGNIWAPDISFHDGTYYLYYAISDFGTNNSAIGVATNPTLDPDDPNYQWADHGIVVESVPGRDDWNAIDPNLVVDEEGTAWLALGSHWSGLKVAQLDESLTALAEPEAWRTIAARHRYWKLDERDAGSRMSGDIEAPFIFEKDGDYYLFASTGQCCRGENSTYQVVVGRAEEVTGPYLDKSGQDLKFGGGTYVVGGNEEWAGVGHNAAYTVDGTDYLVFHGYDISDDGDAKLLIEEIQWDAQGWPTVTLD